MFSSTLITADSQIFYCRTDEDAGAEELFFPHPTTSDTVRPQLQNQMAGTVCRSCLKMTFFLPVAGQSKFSEVNCEDNFNKNDGPHNLPIYLGSSACAIKVSTFPSTANFISMQPLPYYSHPSCNSLILKMTGKN